LVGLGTLLAAAGCRPPPTEADLRREVERLTRQLDQKNSELAAQQAAVQELNRKLAAAQGVSQTRLDTLFYPDQIVIDRLSGGYDDDGRPGDDGVVVYVRPLDRVGDALKTAGSIRVQVFDLAEGEGRLIAECFVPAEQAGEIWYGKLLTYHFTVKCPWKSSPPAHDELTIRVTFENVMPPRVLTAQTVVRVKRVR
jgi:hypothetical protein